MFAKAALLYCLVRILFLLHVGNPIPTTGVDFDSTKRSVTQHAPLNHSEEACPIAYTHPGTVRGVHLNDDVSAFLGAPYAHPPVNELRFRPAVPLEPSDDVLDASHFGPVCHQFHYRTILLGNEVETTPQSEDCLNLNKFVPRNRPDDEALPTMLWSYGGAFANGGASAPRM